MKDLKNSQKAIAPYLKDWLHQLWRPYAALAVSVGVGCTSAFSILVPATDEESLLAFPLGDSVLEVSAALIVAAAVGLVALVMSVFLALRAHKRMMKLLSGYGQKELLRGRKNVLLIEVGMLFAVALIALSLPTVILLLSALMATRSGMMLDAAATPPWSWAAIFLLSTVGIGMLEAFATIARACFRDVPLRGAEGNSAETPV